MHARKGGWICLVSSLLASIAGAEAPKNVLFFIGDGMGFEQVEAARMYNGDPLSFESLPYQGEVTTYSADNTITDSAAAATALATGVKVDNGVISVAIPGDGSEILTLLEQAKLEGKSVGLITTAYLTHATPAAFGAHDSNRANTDAIGNDYLTQTLPNVLYGGGENGLSETDTQNAGYTVVKDTAGFSSLGSQNIYQAALFGGGYMPYKVEYLGMTYPYPTLLEMVTKAIAVLSQNPNGFFLMVEGARIDHACHSNLLEEFVHETLDFADAVQVGMDWLASNASDTLVLVTADHETGGLTVDVDNGAGSYPSVSFSSTGHTGVNVPIYAGGVNSELVGGVMDNTDMPWVCTADMTPVPEPTNPYPADGAIEIPLDAELTWRAGDGSVQHHVYWSEDVLEWTDLGITTDTWIAPPAMNPNMTYYWQVVEEDGAGTAIVGGTGAVWSFSTTDVPEPVTNLSPSEGAFDVSTDAVLSWQVGARTDSVEVYLGTDAVNLPFASTSVGSSYDPGDLQEGTTYYWRIDAVNTAGVMPGSVWSFTTAVAPPPASVVATDESTSKGTVLSGSYQDTQISDDTYEVFKEALNVSNKNGYSTLDHTWTFDVGSSPSAVLYVEAYHSNSVDGDDFVFSYSLDNESFHELLTITKLLDTDNPQQIAFPEPLSGMVYVRVQDTDHTKKNQALDTLYVDHLYILSSQGGVIHQYEATAPSPADGAFGVSPSVVLSWVPGEDAIEHNVYFTTDWEYMDDQVPVTQTENTFVPTEELAGLTTYFWRVDEVRSGGEISEGVVWSFTTAPGADCVPSVMVVESVVLATLDGSKGRKSGEATVTIVNDCEKPVEGALVTGHFTGSFTTSVSGTTDANGTVTLTSGIEVRKPVFDFVVDSVSHPDLLNL